MHASANNANTMSSQVCVCKQMYKSGKSRTQINSLRGRKSIWQDYSGMLSSARICVRICMCEYVYKVFAHGLYNTYMRTYVSTYYIYYTIYTANIYIYIYYKYMCMDVCLCFCKCSCITCVLLLLLLLLLVTLQLERHIHTNIHTCAYT